MKLNEIDYSALETTDFWDKAVREKFKIPSKLFWALCIILTFVMLVITRQPGLVVLPVSIILTVITSTVYKYKNDQWKRFAAMNGWGTTPGPLATLGFVPPSLMDAGRNRKLSDVVHADIDEHMCSIYMYEFVTGGGKSTQHHYYTVARVLLPKSFPHLLLDSKQSYAIRHKGTASTLVKLEGNFNEHFRLSHAKDEHIDALSIITPDVMQTLIDFNVAQDIEIVDQNIYFMMHSDQRSMENMQKLITSIDALADELVHKAKTLRYDGGVPNQTYLTQVASEYFKSGERVMKALWMVIFWVVMAPFIIFIILGILTSLQGQ